MKGFDAEFQDLDHYIRVVTERIWEGRRLDDIRRYYGEGCAVETPSDATIGIAPVIEGTQATLAAFPDRRLLAEDVIVSGDERSGFLSSHRIFSPMTHAGPGVFGPPSCKPVFARTIADCVCIDNRIVHEWLVRDQSAIARQIGQHERDLAQRWLDARGGWRKPPMPPPPVPYRSFIDPNAVAQAYAASYGRLWSQGVASAFAATHHAAAIVALPGGEVAVGATALSAFWEGMLAALPKAQFAVEHLVANERTGRVTSLALRWRAHAIHCGPGRYGPPSGHAVEVLGICHADVEQGRIVREWVLIDDVATWMQVLDARQ
jgi:predicted ester cyclase